MEMPVRGLRWAGWRTDQEVENQQRYRAMVESDPNDKDLKMDDRLTLGVNEGDDVTTEERDQGRGDDPNASWCQYSPALEGP